jgi:hypothetical protein
MRGFLGMTVKEPLCICFLPEYCLFAKMWGKLCRRNARVGEAASLNKIDFPNATQTTMEKPRQI